MTNSELIKRIKNYDINQEVIQALFDLLYSKTEFVYKDACPDFIRKAIYIKGGKIKMHSLHCDFSNYGDFEYRYEEVKEWLQDDLVEVEEESCE